METQAQTGTDVAKASLFNDEQLANIKGYKDAAALLVDAGVTPEFISDYGTGFKVVSDKSVLIGRPFLILSWRFNEGDFGDKGFVSAEIVTDQDEKFILNDGSTGIRDQLATVTSQRVSRKHSTPYAGLVCANGLTKTNYFYNETTQETSSKAREGKGWVSAATFYLAT